MDKDTFSKLKVADIKALFETEQALEILPLAQGDTRSSVQKLAASYIKRQEIGRASCRERVSLHV